ncbi:hypothetical protein HD554DRAFT_2036971 [Boletus coccyginus]|nr:hypothetical protein HD554DRAFT_2036971 [Boletus coccyginus]
MPVTFNIAFPPAIHTLPDRYCAALGRRSDNDHNILGKVEDEAMPYACDVPATSAGKSEKKNFVVGVSSDDIPTIERLETPRASLVSPHPRHVNPSDSDASIGDGRRERLLLSAVHEHSFERLRPSLNPPRAHSHSDNTSISSRPPFEPEGDVPNAMSTPILAESRPSADFMKVDSPIRPPRRIRPLPDRSYTYTLRAAAAGWARCGLGKGKHGGLLCNSIPARKSLEKITWWIVVVKHTWRTPPVSARPPSSGASSAFYERRWKWDERGNSGRGKENARMLRGEGGTGYNGDDAVRRCWVRGWVLVQG